MPINYTPANALSPQQHQLLIDLESYPISLIGNEGIVITVNISDIRTSIVFENGNVQHYSDDYWTSLRDRLNNYQHEIQKLSDALENANEDYEIVRAKISLILQALDNHTIQDNRRTSKEELGFV